MTKIAHSTYLMHVARNAALTVAPQLRAAFRSTMDFSCKRDEHDIVTLHDKASEKRIAAFIFDRVPDSIIVGEEDGRYGGGSGSVVWFVDPIDGTSNFASGIAFWCVSIAAEVDGQIVAGVIHDPSSGDVFSADLQGAYLNDEPLVSRAAPTQERAMLLTSFPNARHLKDFGDDAFDAQAQLLEAFLAVRNLGSGALQLAHVAAGWADATLGFSTNAWDIAAGAFIVSQAGGRFTSLDKGRDCEPAHLATDYFAVGKDGDYPTLDRMARIVSGAAGVHLTKEPVQWRA